MNKNGHYTGDLLLLATQKAKSIKRHMASLIDQECCSIVHIRNDNSKQPP